MKPYLASEACNNGWMNNFEKEMIKFCQPIFTESAPITLSHYQTRVFAGWISLTTILAEYTNKKLSYDDHPIGKDERSYFKKYLEPPFNWIVVSTLDNADSEQTYRHHAIGIYEAEIISSSFYDRLKIMSQPR
jgi:hypothetical protein